MSSSSSAFSILSRRLLSLPRLAPRFFSASTRSLDIQLSSRTSVDFCLHLVSGQLQWSVHEHNLLSEHRYGLCPLVACGKFIACFPISLHSVSGQNIRRPRRQPRHQRRSIRHFLVQSVLQVVSKSSDLGSPSSDGPFNGTIGSRVPHW